MENEKTSISASEAMQKIISVSKALDDTSRIIQELEKRLYYITKPLSPIGVTGRSGKTFYNGHLEEGLSDLRYKAEENYRMLTWLLERIDI